MSFQRFSWHHTFLDGLRSSLDMTMEGQRTHPQNSNITPAVHVLPRHNPDHPLAGERQEFRTNAGPILAPIPFRTRSKDQDPVDQKVWGASPVVRSPGPDLLQRATRPESSPTGHRFKLDRSV